MKYISFSSDEFEFGIEHMSGEQVERLLDLLREFVEEEGLELVGIEEDNNGYITGDITVA